MFCALAGCTSPVARHRLHVTSADPLPRWPSPVARHPLAGCSSRPVHPLAVARCPLHVTRWPVARQRTRWPSPLAVSCTSPVARHRLHVTRCRHVSGPVAPLAVTGCTSPAGRLHVSGPAGRHRWPVARHVCTSPVARHVSGPGCPAGRHRLHVTRWPVARQRRHPLAGCRPLHVTGCTSRQRTRCPAGRHPLAGCSSRLNVTGCTSRQRTR